MSNKLEPSVQWLLPGSIGEKDVDLVAIDTVGTAWCLSIDVTDSVLPGFRGCI